MHTNSELQIPIGLLNDLYDARNRDDLLNTYSRWSQKVIRADRCGIALQSDNDHLTVTTMTGEAAVEESQKYRINDSLLGAVFASQTPLMIEDLETNPNPACRILARAGLGTLMMAPVLIRGRCYGTIAVSLRKGAAPGATDFALVQALGRCLASQLMVIERMEGLTNALTTDTLTKARNRRYYGSVIDTLWGQWQTDQIPFSILLIDIDHFKQINDRYGHGVGDQVLCAFVNRLGANVRTGDKIVRMGGEEFAITFAGKQIPDGMVVANRLHGVIRSKPFRGDTALLPITASFGLTEVGPFDETHNDVFERADRALYQAKGSGRDRIIASQPERPDRARAQAS